MTQRVPQNPYGVGFSAKETVLSSELRAKRRVNSDASRVWKVVNHASRNTVTGAHADGWAVWWSSGLHYQTV